MGPPIVTGGEAHHRTASSCHGSGFNGAADSHRRREAAPSSGRQKQASFNGAADSHRRRVSRHAAPPAHVLASMGPPIVTGGEADVRDVAEGGLDASMGPPIVTGGESRSASRSPRPAAGFNGAADSHRRRVAEPPDDLVRLGGFNGAADSHRRRVDYINHRTIHQSTLQWGRR